ncbi:MAG TPA: T9SS type A sorting domain-containing protein [Flavobacteriales bacterium]|nr:T9SS type A sorting domain-containing protein [Flavobacteriales bacterium]
MRTSLIFLLGLISYSSFAQINLVPNGSFEVITTCPNGSSTTIAQIELAQPWWNACNQNTFNTPDIFNPCNTDIFNIPLNLLGYQDAYDGIGYSGFLGWSGTLPEDWGEHFEVKLTTSIKANAQYRLCFQLSLADYSGAYGLSKLRFALTNDSLIGIASAFFNSGVNPFPTLNPIDLYETSNTSEINFENWTEVCTDFVLNRNANYLTIGTFKKYGDNQDTLLINPEEPWNVSNYYFIDDVSLICITPTGCDDVGVEDVEEKSTFRLFPNPSNNTITLQSPLIKSGTNLFLRDISGRLIHQLKIQELNQIELNTQDLADGIYLVQVIGEEGKEVRERFVVQH